MVFLKYARIFCIWLIFVFSAVVLLLGFELVNGVIAESGFSSGEVFVFSEAEGIIEGEFFGRSFNGDFSAAGEFLHWADNLALLLPPYFQFFLRGIFLLAANLL